MRRRAGGERTLAVLATDVAEQGLPDLASEQRDDLAVQYARRICSAVRATDVVGRVAELDFAVLCEGVGALAHAVAIAQRIVAALEPPLAWGEVVLLTDPHVGIGLPLDGPDDAERLVERAFEAMHACRVHGSARIDVMAGSPDLPPSPFQ
jgi:GGDEF domain-containing protein